MKECKHQQWDFPGSWREPSGQLGFPGALTIPWIVCASQSDSGAGCCQVTRTSGIEGSLSTKAEWTLSTHHSVHLLLLPRESQRGHFPEMGSVLSVWASVLMTDNIYNISCQDTWHKFRNTFNTYQQFPEMARKTVNSEWFSWRHACVSYCPRTPSEVLLGDLVAATDLIRDRIQWSKCEDLSGLIHQFMKHPGLVMNNKTAIPPLGLWSHFRNRGQNIRTK